MNTAGEKIFIQRKAVLHVARFWTLFNILIPCCSIFEQLANDKGIISDFRALCTVFYQAAVVRMNFSITYFFHSNQIQYKYFV